MDIFSWPGSWTASFSGTRARSRAVATFFLREWNARPGRSSPRVRECRKLYEATRQHTASLLKTYVYGYLNCIQSSVKPWNASVTICSIAATSSLVSFPNSFSRRFLPREPSFCLMNMMRLSASWSGISTMFMISWIA